MQKQVQIDLSVYSKINQNYYINQSKCIGKGIFGIVYEGYSLKLKKEIAVKYIDAHFWNKYQNIYENQIIQLNELSKLNHPNIMKYYGNQKSHAHQTGVYLFLQLCSGGNLSSKVGRVKQKELIILFGQLLNGITFLHSQKKLHRDLKPQNILLDSQGNVKIGDFGLARDSDIIMTKSACTPLYSSPQVIFSNHYDYRCDVWSLGAILYELINGQKLLGKARSHQQIQKQFGKIQRQLRKIKLIKKISPQWQFLLNQMLTYNWIKRPYAHQVYKKFKIIEQAFKKSEVVTQIISQEQYLIQKSNENLEVIENSLKFINEKCGLMLTMPRKFCQKNLRIKNLSKYILMFLAQCYVISKKIFVLKEIQNEKISTVEGPMYFKNIHSSCQQKLRKIIQQHSNIFKKQISKHEQTLHNEICPKIIKEYLNRPKQAKLLGLIKGLVNQINQANEKKYGLYCDYLQQIKVVGNNSLVYNNNVAIQQMSDEDLDCYMWIRISCNFQKIFFDLGCKTQNFLKMTNEQINIKSRKEKIIFTKQLNKIEQ